MPYSESTVRDKISSFKGKWETLYRDCALAANSNPTAGGRPYSEVCADWLKPMLYQMLEGIGRTSRKTSYHKKEHEELKAVAHSTVRGTKVEARRECHLAQALYLEFRKRAIAGINHDGILFIDYEVPTADGRRGAIDLLGYSPSQDRIFFFELKFNDRKRESLLKCFLEVLTYYKKIDLAKFKADFQAYDERISDKTSISIAPLFVKGGSQYKEWEKLDERPSLVDLVRAIRAEGIDTRIGILSQGNSTTDVSNRVLDLHSIE